jgi:hypothetical protein
MHEARYGGFASQGRWIRCARQSSADARGKELQMLKARHARCAMLSRADARGRAGQIREARPADERIKAG